MLYLGIDQHKRQLTVNLRSEDGSVILKRQVSTQWEKVRAFFADLTEKAKPEGGFLAVLEVCGMNPWLLDMLKEYGCRETVVTQPTERSKQKTDRRDAGVLSHLLWVHRQHFVDGKHPLGMRRVQPATPQEADDRQVTALRARLTKKRTAVLDHHTLVLSGKKDRKDLLQFCNTPLAVLFGNGFQIVRFAIKHGLVRLQLVPWPCGRSSLVGHGTFGFLPPCPRFLLGACSYSFQKGSDSCCESVLGRVPSF